MEPKIEYQPPPPQDNITELTNDKDVIKIYTNGFQCQLTLDDANIVLKQNGANVALINMTLTGVKSLYDQLAVLIAHFEKTSGRKVESYQELLDKHQERDNKAKNEAK